MNQNGNRDPIADLEHRWAADKSSQLTVQLAEEHRRHGNLGRAIEVLRQGLEHHPRHLAARVALGRYLLESGDFAAALVALQSVVDDDPTHLVANKLLVSAAVELDDAAEARRRLDVYGSLNEGDPEIDLLRSRVDRIATDAGEDQHDGSIVGGSTDPTVAETEDAPFAAVLKSVDRERYRRALWEEGVFGARREAVEATAEEKPPLSEATVTLGRLYLEQGHRIEAERVFRAVLRTKPGSAEAMAGLREATSEGRSLSAGDLVDRDALNAATALGRKRLVLESYRERLRAGIARS
jgi:lipopolysaccharide biosynthesis regulator YciM